MSINQDLAKLIVNEEIFLKKYLPIVKDLESIEIKCLAIEQVKLKCFSLDLKILKN
jgi:hypothetical protein